MSQPKVSIVVPAYLESNLPYLKACLDSIDNLDYPKDRLDVVMVSPWAAEYALLREGYRLTTNKSRANSFSGSINTGVDHADPDSDFILILSDDCIIARDALKHMVGHSVNENIIMAAVSNCDLGWKYNLALPYVYPNRYYKLDQVNPTDLMNAQSYYPSGIIFTEMLCFYSVLIPRKVWKKVGELDEAFNVGYEDSDDCMRAKEKGAQLGIALDSLIWHAGGATSSVITEEMREKNRLHFDQKWAAK